MSAESRWVFFYGLFMDEHLLAEQRVAVEDRQSGYVDGYRLVIGERASLVPEVGERAYGVVMRIRQADVERLYSEASVADYIAETVSVQTADDRKIAAECYNLPVEKIAGRNAAYAEKLRALAAKLGFPEAYRKQIGS